jgi:hypothetical protein
MSDLKSKGDVASVNYKSQFIAFARGQSSNGRKQGLTVSQHFTYHRRDSTAVVLGETRKNVRSFDHGQGATSCQK